MSSNKRLKKMDTDEKFVEGVDFGDTLPEEVPVKKEFDEKSVDEIQNLLEEIDSKNFIKVQKLYDVGNLGYVIQEVGTRNKKFVPVGDLYHIEKVRVFEIPLVIFNNYNKV